MAGNRRYAFAKRHYELIAGIIRDTRVDMAGALHTEPEVEAAAMAIDTIQSRLIAEFIADSERFDVARFREACRVS